MFLNWREMNPDKTVNLNGRTGGVKWMWKVSSYRTELKCTEITSIEITFFEYPAIAVNICSFFQNSEQKSVAQ